jgi:DnaJ domain/Domain of unknown function (DUF4388)
VMRVARHGSCTSEVGENRNMPAVTPSLDALRGPLSQSSLVQILRTLFVGGLTGRLLLAHDGENLDLRFISGYIVGGSSEPVPGRLGEIMSRSGVLSRRDLDSALEQAGREGRRLGPVLVERRVATRTQIEEALRLQVRGVLFTAFFWPGGTFQFEANDGSLTRLEEISLRLGTAQLILEVVNSLADATSVREALGDLDRRLAAVDGPRVHLEGVTLSPGDAFVLSRADGVLTAKEILEITPLPRETVERSLLSLLSVGVVEWRTRSPLRATDPSQTVALSRDEVHQEVEARHVQDTDDRLREIDERFQGLMGKTHYDVLGVSIGATATEVKEAYQKLTRLFHPDTAGNLPAEAAAKVQAIFMRVSEAFNALRTATNPPTAKAGVDSRRLVPPPRTQAAGTADSPKPPTEVGAAPSLEEALTKAEEALATRPWETLAAVERLLPETSGPLRQRARLLRARAQLKNPVSWRAGELELREMQQEDPNLLEAPLLLGGFYKDRGLTARAAAMFSRVLELRPGHRRAAEELQTLPKIEPGSARVEKRSAARAS